MTTGRRHCRCRRAVIHRGQHACTLFYKEAQDINPAARGREVKRRDTATGTHIDIRPALDEKQQQILARPPGQRGTQRRIGHGIFGNRIDVRTPRNENPSSFQLVKE